MTTSIADAARVGAEEALDILTGRDSIPEAMEDVYERLGGEKKSRHE